MNKKKFVLGVIVIFFSLIILGMSLNSIQTKKDTFDKHNIDCSTTGKQLDKNKAELEHLDPSVTKNLMIQQHNLNVEEFNRVCG